MTHIVNVEKPKQFSCDGRRWDVNVMNGHCMDLAVICGAVKSQMPFYKGIWGIKVGAYVMCQRFATLLISDAERDEGRPQLCSKPSGVGQRSMSWLSS
jgi:hypothetical protein